MSRTIAMHSGVVAIGLVACFLTSCRKDARDSGLEAPSPTPPTEPFDASPMPRDATRLAALAPSPTPTSEPTSEDDSPSDREGHIPLSTFDNADFDRIERKTPIPPLLNSSAYALNKETAIMLVHTGHRGACAAYEVGIMNGFAYFRGDSCTGTRGYARHPVTESSVQQLLALLEARSFTKLHRLYSFRAVDLPRVRLILRQGSRAKIVAYDSVFGIGSAKDTSQIAALAQIAAEIDRVAGTAAWVKTPARADADPAPLPMESNADESWIDLAPARASCARLAPPGNPTYPYRLSFDGIGAISFESDKRAPAWGPLIACLKQTAANVMAPLPNFRVDITLP